MTGLKVRRFFFIFLFFALPAGTCLAQIESSVGTISGFPVEKWYEVSVDSGIIAHLQGLYQPKDKPFQFAFPVQLNLTPANSGFIKRTGNEVIWTIGIHSLSAKSINIILKPFRIPAGAYFFVYDPERKVVRGAFGVENNNPEGVLPVMPVPGEYLILEYHVPSGSVMEGSMAISQVSHDFLGIFGNTGKDNRFGLSQPCNVDITCPSGNIYSDQKRSVCRILVNGIELCSGVLVNNTNQENRALLITAQHCISSNSAAASSIFIFDYESPWCDGPDGNVYHSISGAVLRATNPQIDFSLVELNSFPPFTYHPYLAGWDVTGAVPSKGAVIHHPMGDVKKISVDNSPLVTDSYTSDYLTNGFWKVLQWNSGTTEGGSSGSPFFDQNRRIIGILTGGEAQCGMSFNDYFAKLSISYALSPYLWMQLKGWIDPAQTGIKIFDGRDPYASNLLTVDTLSNLASAEQRLLTPFTTGTGFSTGYNSDSLTAYAEYFKNPLGKQVSELILNIASVNSVLSSDSASVYILSDGSTPGSVLAHQKVFLNQAKDTFSIRMDFKNTVITGGNFYVAWKIYYHTSAFTETRQFATFHSPDRVNPALNTAWFREGTLWKPFTMHPFAPMSVSLDVKAIVIGNAVYDALPEIRNESPGFLVYPNPNHGLVYISSPDNFPDAEVLVFDASGRQVFQKILKGSFPGRAEADLTSLPTGTYYMVVVTGNKREVHKLILGL